MNDNRIFRNSDIYLEVRNNLQHYFPDNEYIIGDKTYPCLSWCIPLYINRGNLTVEKRYFNTIVAKTRQTIERPFPLLFGKFRVHDNEENEANSVQEVEGVDKRDVLCRRLFLERRRGL